MRRTKIICTIGPASDDPRTLGAMIQAGMNYARLNLSHSDLKYHKQLIKHIRRAAKKERATVGIIADLQGPKIRLGRIKEGGIILLDRAEVVLTTDKPKADELPVTYPLMHKDVRAGNRILIDDGLIELKVLKVVGQKMYATVVFGGTVTSHKGINLPDSEVRLKSLTPKDRKDVRFAIRERVPWIALSFVRTARDIQDLRKIIGKNPQKIIAKIEKPEAVRNIAAIIKEADGIMIARGDLGIETPQTQVPIVQKDIIRACLSEGKPVIVATQMLDSMIKNPRPTRAEVSDVANAVIDHTDAIMLSGETASGAFPVRAVTVMAKIALQTEKSVYDNFIGSLFKHSNDPIVVGAEALVHLFRETNSRAIYVYGEDAARLSRLISHFRPECTIFARIRNEFGAGQLFLNWGVQPLLVDLEKTKFVKSGDRVLFVYALKFPAKSSMEIKIIG